MKLMRFFFHAFAIIVHFFLVCVVWPVVGLIGFLFLTALSVIFGGGMYGSIEAFNLLILKYLKWVQDLLNASFNRGPGEKLFAKNSG